MSEENRRAEDALRAAIADVDTPGAVDPGAARARVRRSRIGGVVAACVGALVLAGGAVFAVQQTSWNTPGISADPASGPESADGWRTEYYRDIRFDVPKSWGYAFEPGPDWCAVGAEGDRAEAGERTEPYVSLGTSAVFRTIACEPEAMPTSLWQEHVVVMDDAEVESVGAEEQVDGWWRFQKQVNGVLVRVVSKDRELADSIIATARPTDSDESGCQPTSELQSAAEARPPEPFDVEKLGPVDEITICQYDTGGDEVPGLRARAQLTGTDAEAVVAAIRDAEPNTKTTCTPDTKERKLFEVAIVLTLKSGPESHQMYLAARGCPSGTEPAIGGFDDGTTIRSLTKAACQPLLVPPIQLQSGTTAVFEKCVR